MALVFSRLYEYLQNKHSTRTILIGKLSLGGFFFLFFFGLVLHKCNMTYEPSGRPRDPAALRISLCLYI